MEGVILAAGRGTRLGPLGERLPKALLYLPGGRLIDYQLQLLGRLGIDHTYVVVGHLWQQLAEHLRGRPGIELVHQDGPPTLEGALQTAGHVLDGPCLILHADNYLSAPPADLLEALQGHRAVFYAGEVGVYALQPEALTEAGSGLEAVRATARSIPLGRWRRNVNDVADLLAVNARLLSDWHHAFHPAAANEGYRPLGEADRMQPPCWVSPRARLTDGQIGPSVTVGPGAQLEEVRLADAIVFPGGRLTAQELRRGLVVGREVFSGE